MFVTPGLLARGLAALVLLGVPASAQSPPAPADQQLLDEVLAALRRSDAPALAERVDFERRADELVQRGRATAHWSELDEMQQMLERRDLAQSWTGNHADFNHEMSLVSSAAVPDPDAGLGPVPDRRIVQAVVRNALAGQQRDLLLVLTPEPRLLDLVLGEPYFAGNNPAGAAGLLPRPELRVEDIPEPHWADAVDDAERADVTGLVQTLVDSVPGVERELCLERLHRNPRSAVAALAERLRALDLEPEPDATHEALLDAALRRITGRPSTFAALRPPGATPAAWRAANRAVVAGWARWQLDNGLTFAVTPIEHPIDPTARERANASRPLDLKGWDTALAKQADDEAAAAAAAAAAGEAGATGAAGGTSSPPELPPLPPPVAGPDTSTSSAPPLEPAPSAADGPARPEPDPSADPSAPPSRDVLSPAAAALLVLNGGHEVAAGTLDAGLSPAVREALNAWAGPAAALGMRVVVTGNPDQIVVGRAPDKLLEQAAGWMDDTWRLLDPVIPRVDSRPPHATVAFLFDEGGSRSAAWRELLKLLVGRNLVYQADVERLQAAPSSLTRRSVPLFLQTSWDITGEGEFQLANEVAHKFAQCLLTERAGQMPPNILWGFGEMAELKLFGSVYQLNASGFVATGDHFDWAVRTRQYLDKHQHKKNWSLAAMADSPASAGMAQEPQMVTWATLACMATLHPEVLKQMLGELAALQAAGAQGDDAAWHGEATATRAVLEARLGPLAPDDISDWLKNHF